MGYTHYFTFKQVRGKAQETEAKYQRAIEDCQRIIRRWYAEYGGLSGYTAHCKIGQYGGVQVNGARDEGCEEFVLREHFNQNFDDGGFNFCKTARYAYDTVVVACLAVLKHRLGDAIEIGSDGTFDNWIEGVEYAKKVTGLKIKNPMTERDKAEALENQKSEFLIA